ncbi:uncharacterized protein LOC6524554 [Drosophila yakuba]|uniref:Uncharacterized protein n=1 Tax=Drosophila yakuba TaxID=7245 RepID=B4Q1Z8_DROYA|nr:uncharacterized protein LOC6524554 [Drosophila yakuba]EDX01519.1 uncharacterized protein Dyak_GE17038 [Drosophila yakuba]
MPVLKLYTFYTKFFPSAKVRRKELRRRWYLLKFRRKLQPRSELKARTICKSVPSIGNSELLSKHVIGSFRLELQCDSNSKRLEITATLANPVVPPDTDPAPEDEQLYELYICSSQGQLLGKVPFTESDYRRAAHTAIECMNI